ncbi:hypothetical protein [Chamaesiphon minutus]|nr:hypothetical protein [Chamaesiphon minutus]
MKESMVVARQEWLDWEFDPPGFSQYGCDDIGDLLASGQMSVEFLDYGDDYEPTEAELEEARLCRSDNREIEAELRRTVSYEDGETEARYEDRISVQVSLQAGRRADRRAKERIEQGLPDLAHNPNAL